MMTITRWSVVVLVSLSALGLPGQAALASSSPNPSPPSTSLRPVTIVEPFRPVLNCNPRTTLGIQGCNEARIVKLDKQADQLSKKIFYHLFDRPARMRFNAAEGAWITYRLAACKSESDLFEYGSGADTEATACMVELSTQHVQWLKNFAHPNHP
jgi:uncharacterized protein YecT (DUF1311 family)